MAIKAVIFDCFGVLVTDGWSPFLHQNFHDKPELRQEISESGSMVDAGLKDYADHLAELAAITGIAHERIHKQINSNQPNKELFNYIKQELKPTYKIGMLSNAGDNHIERLFEPWQSAVLDEVVLSCDLGVTKPHPIMYETVATKLDVLPEECLLIDDIERYCKGAEEVGMQAIPFVTSEQTIAAIKEVLHA